MPNEAASIAVFVVLAVVDIIAPIALLVLISRQNFRYRRSGAHEAGFWAAALGYAAFISLVAVGLIELAIHPQIEGLAYFSTLFCLALFGLPGSLVPTFTTFVLASAHASHPAFLGSFTLWLAIGTVSWSLVNAVGLRWLLLIGRRRRARAAVQAPTDLASRV
jgi:hypothetical protein